MWNLPMPQVYTLAAARVELPIVEPSILPSQDSTEEAAVQEVEVRAALPPVPLVTPDHPTSEVAVTAIVFLIQFEPEEPAAPDVDVEAITTRAEPATEQENTEALCLLHYLQLQNLLCQKWMWKQLCLVHNLPLLKMPLPNTFSRRLDPFHESCLWK